MPTLAQHGADKTKSEPAVTGGFVRRGLFKFFQLGEHRVIHRSDSVVFVEKGPAHDTLLVQYEQSGFGNLSVRVVKVVGVDDLVIDVRKNGKWQLEFIDKFAALVLTVYTDRYNLRPLSNEFLVVLGQTGQLLSAVRSPVASIKD